MYQAAGGATFVKLCVQEQFCCAEPLSVTGNPHLALVWVCSGIMSHVTTHCIRNKQRLDAVIKLDHTAT